MSIKVCRSYFNGFQEISNIRKNNAKTNILAALKILSYLTGLIPLGFGVAYGFYALHGRINKKTDTSETDKAVKEKVKEHFSNPKVSTPPDDKPTNDKAVPDQTAAAKPVNDKAAPDQIAAEKPVNDKPTVTETLNSKERTPVVNSRIFQTPDSRLVHSYPGDLTPEEKAGIKRTFIDDFKLSIAFDQFPEVEVTIRRENIFNSKAEVIVNAANTDLGGGGGIDGAIHREGGNEYANLHKELQTFYNSDFVSGHAALIGSGLLKEKYRIDNVIVVAGPIGKTTPEKENALYSCYRNSLTLAHEKGKASIALPAISTGIFDFPKDRAAAISLKAVKDFLVSHKGTTLKNISIHFLPTEPRAELERYSV